MGSPNICKVPLLMRVQMDTLIKGPFKASKYECSAGPEPGNVKIRWSDETRTLLSHFCREKSEIP